MVVEGHINGTSNHAQYIRTRNLVLSPPCGIMYGNIVTLTTTMYKVIFFLSNHPSYNTLVGRV